MANITVSPTRMELTRLKGKLRTAQRGHKLLKDKRDELMKQFLDTVREVRSLRAEVEEELMTVHNSFTVASALMSSEALEQALLYPKQSVELTQTTQNIMSVNVPVYHFQTKTKSDSDIYPYGFAATSGELDAAVDALGKVFQKMLKLAEIEKSAQLMAEEIEKTRRRVNALEYVVIPDTQEALYTVPDGATVTILASSLFQLLLLGLILVGSFWLSSSMGNVQTSVPTILAFFQGWGRPFLLLAGGVSGSDLFQLLILWALCLGPFLAVVWLFAWQYKAIITRLSTHRTRSDYKLGRLSSSNQQGALLRKEARRWFGTPIYVFNTGIGLLMLPGAGVAALIYQESIRHFLIVSDGLVLAPLLAAGIAFCLSTVAITGSSISLEGKQIWLLQCAPVPVTTILGMKVVFQLMVTLPCLAAGWVMLSLAFALTPAEWALLLLNGLLFALMCAPFGLWINLHFPKLDAVNDAVVVKQSAAAMLSTFLPMVLILVFFLMWLFFSGPLGSVGLLSIYAILLAVCTALSFLALVRQGPDLFRRLEEK